MSAQLGITAAKWNSKAPAHCPLLLVGNADLRDLCDILSLSWAGYKCQFAGLWQELL